MERVLFLRDRFIWPFPVFVPGDLFPDLFPDPSWIFPTKSSGQRPLVSVLIRHKLGTLHIVSDGTRRAVSNANFKPAG